MPLFNPPFKPEHRILMENVAEYPDYLRENSLGLLRQLDNNYENRAIMTLLGFATKPDQLVAALEVNPNIETYVLLEELVNRHVKAWFNEEWGNDIIERLRNQAVRMMEDSTWEWD